ncbi:MAG: SagB/ThcOx family dehydrogenase [Deltaproteobacteria bacterium]|nr:SagB/ThcOx family dehydrogenase [Deltaproteobacteria bacterium]
MKMRTVFAIAVSLIFCAGILVPAFGQDMKPIQLPEPKLDKSKPLMQTLKDRKTTREFSSGNLSQQTLSNLLWAAFGISRPDSGRRTAPSALNRQEIDVYVATAEGTYLYDPKGNALVPVASGDLRSLTGTQSYFEAAAVNLVYVADLAKMGEGEEAGKMFLAAADTGFIAENVYLFCSSEELATVFRVSIDKPKLGEALKLSPEQRITGAQTVGLPKPKK